MYKNNSFLRERCKGKGKGKGKGGLWGGVSPRRTL